MTTIGSRIARARQLKGWSQARLGEATGKGQTTISSWERDRTEPTREDVARVAAELGMSAAAIELEDGLVGASRGYPHIGSVGAGGEGHYIDDYELGDAREFIEPMPGMPVNADIIVLDIDGDSMIPAVFDGDLAFFGPLRRDIDALLNKRVMARLDDGRKFFKILKRGAAPGLYTLRSLNPAFPDIEDVRVSWVLPYQGVRARG